MKHPTETCALSDGRRIKYRVAKRKLGPCFYAYFAGNDGLRKELSTGETNLKRARESAVILIAKEYEPKVHLQRMGWEEAIALAVEHMRGKNLRHPTIETYKSVIQTFRELFPAVTAPCDVTPEMAEQYKLRCVKLGKSPHTVRGDLNELGALFGKWWCEVCKIIPGNPFKGVEPPKTDDRDPRIVSEGEFATFLGWLARDWEGWRLPVLFLEVKASIGCRMTELAALPTSRLVVGRVSFEAEVAKGRRSRSSKLPADLYDELSKIAGPSFVFERFPEQQREILLARGRRHQAARVTFPYDPGRLVNWLQDRLAEFRRVHPEIPRFKLHNLRGTAMSRAMAAGASYDRASIAFGCNAATMKRHYVKLDETAISDDVMDLIQRRK